MAGRVEGKVAFITGAARGQGRAHAVRLAQEGADIIAIEICKPIEGFLNPPSTPEDLARTADLARGHNRRIVTAEIDVRDYEALKAAVDSGVEQLGRLDVIVANAGISNTGSDEGDTLDKVSERDWQDMIDVNLSGVWKTVKAGVRICCRAAVGFDRADKQSTGSRPIPFRVSVITWPPNTVSLVSCGRSPSNWVST